MQQPEGTVKKGWDSLLENDIQAFNHFCRINQYFLSGSQTLGLVTSLIDFKSGSSAESQGNLRFVVVTVITLPETDLIIYLPFLFFDPRRIELAFLSASTYILLKFSHVSVLFT